MAAVVRHGSDARASLFAVAVAASALAAVVTYRYINVSAVGPLPDMYEPTWAVSGKHLSAFAVAIAQGLALLGLISPSEPHQPNFGGSASARPLHPLCQLINSCMWPAARQTGRS